MFLVYGFVFWRMYEVVVDKVQVKVFFKEMYFKVFVFYCYFYDYCDLEEEGLVYICYFWEGGIDNSLIWDCILLCIQIDCD